MDTDMIQKVQRWVALDNKLETKKSRVKEYSDEKKIVEEGILRYVEENDKAHLRIKISDGYIDFNEQRSQQMITIKYLKDMLNAYFDSVQSNTTNNSNSNSNAGEIDEKNEKEDNGATTTEPDVLTKDDISAESIFEYLLQNREVKTKLVMRRHLAATDDG
jgi:hypothetical protein